MVLRDLAAASFNLTEAGGSALTNNCRPLVSTVLAIWALAKGAKEAAHKPNAPKYIQAFIAARLLIVPLGMLCNGIAIVVFGAAPPFRTTYLPKTVSRPTRLAKYEAVSFEGDNEAWQQPRKRLPLDTLLALVDIIATVPGARGWYLGHFLGLMCLFRQPPLNPVFRPPNRLRALQGPVSACQHGL